MKTSFSITLVLFLAVSVQAREFKPNYEKKLGADLKELNFNFKSGQVQIRYDSDAKQSDVRCELQPNTAPKSEFTFEDRYKEFRCEITLSRALKVTVKGEDGQVQAENLIAETNISLKNGQLQFTSNSNVNYKFDASVENGMKPMLPMNAGKKTGKEVPVKLSVKNGMLSVQ